MKIGTLLLASALAVSCATSRPKGSWRSNGVVVDLVPVGENERSSSRFDQYYNIRFTNSSLAYRVPSFLDRSEVEESFARASQSFGRSSVHFSPSGRTVVIKDDSPGSASNTGHQLIVGIFGENPILMTLRGPERPGLLIENWPIVTSVTDDEVSFQYDDDQASFALRIDALLRDAKRIKKLQGD